MNPLDQLLPPIAPAAVGWWPLAPGWWVLLVGLPLLFWGAWYAWRKWRSLAVRPTTDPVRQAALDVFMALQLPQPEQDAAPWLQEVNALLKRLCRTRYPEQSSHTLNGVAWLAFLDAHCPDAALSRWPMLTEGLYRAHCVLDADTLSALHTALQQWISEHV